MLKVLEWNVKPYVDYSTEILCCERSNTNPIANGSHELAQKFIPPPTKLYLDPLDPKNFAVGSLDPK